MRQNIYLLAKLKEKTTKIKGKWNKHYCLIAKKIDDKQDIDHLTFDNEDIQEMVFL